MKRMDHIRWWHRVLCRIWCPTWNQSRPATDEKGPWVAVAILQTHRGDFERDWRRVENGLQDAYEVARWLGLKLQDGNWNDLGVRWAVRRPEDERYSGLE